MLAHLDIALLSPKEWEASVQHQSRASSHKSAGLIGISNVVTDFIIKKYNNNIFEILEIKKLLQLS